MARVKCNHCGKLYPYQPGDSVYCTIGCKQDAEEAIEKRHEVERAEPVQSASSEKP